MAYIGWTRNVSHGGNECEVHLALIPNLKIDGYFAETNEVFEYLGCLSHGCLHAQSTQNHWQDKKICRAGLKKVKRGCRKLKMPVMWFVSIWGPNFRNHLRENPGLENALCSHPYVKNSPINIRGALYGGTTEATKTYYRVEEGEKIRYVVVVRLYTIIYVNMASFPRATQSVSGCRLSA